MSEDYRQTRMTTGYRAKEDARIHAAWNEWAAPAMTAPNPPAIDLQNGLDMATKVIAALEKENASLRLKLGILESQ